MKRLTWALWSLMLFLGMGTAFAEEVEKPVITPATGSAVTIGDLVTITCATSGATIHYTTVNSWVSETDPVYTAPFALTEDMIKTSGLYKDEIVIRAFAVLGEAESDPTFVRYSEITIPGAEPEGVEQPEFSPVSGSTVRIGDKVTISCATPGATIRYTATDTYVSEYTSPEYTEPFELTESMIKKSGQNEGKIVIYAMAYKGDEESLRATAIYEVATEPETLPTPSFANVSEVTQGEALEIEWPADLNLKKYLNWGFILYVENDDNTELEMPEGATVSDLFMLMMGNGGGVSPWAKTGEPAFKIAYYDGDEEDWPSAIALSQTGVVKVRARLAAGKSQEDDPLVYSDEFTATYTVKERPRPTAPTFLVNDVEVEGASVVVESGAMVGFTNGYSDDEYMIFYVIDGEDADFENINMENLWFQEKVKLYIAGDEMDGEFAVTMGQTVKAATGQVMQDGSLWWSDIVTVVFTIKGDGPDAPETPGLPETVAVPTFVPASGEVEKGTEVTWTWNGEYDYDVMGVVYVANGTDADLDIDAAGLMELIAAWGEEEDDMEREDGVAYLYYEEAGAYKIEKNVTLKARLVLGALKEDSEEDEPGLELALSPVVEAAYTVKGEGPAVEPVEAPVFNPATGAVKKGTKVSIACATEGAVIYYTVNGNEPTAESTEYKDEIEITANVTVKAIAIKGEAKSEVVEAAYTIDFTANEDEELAGVTVYPNPSNGLFNLELPVAVTIEVFASNGVLTQRVNAAAGVSTLTLDRSGIYFLRIAGEGRTVIKRVIVR